MQAKDLQWGLSFETVKTRMTTFIKSKFKKSDDQTNIDKYSVTANISEYHIILKSFLESLFQNSWILGNYYVKNVCKNVKNQHV